MQTKEEKPKISYSEIALILKWPWSTVNSIVKRQSPADKLKIIQDCQAQLIESKKKLQEDFQNQEN